MRMRIPDASAEKCAILFLCSHRIDFPEIAYWKNGVCVRQESNTFVKTHSGVPYGGSLWDVLLLFGNEEEARDPAPPPKLAQQRHPGPDMP